MGHTGSLGPTSQRGHFLLPSCCATKPTVESHSATWKWPLQKAPQQPGQLYAQTKVRIVPWWQDIPESPRCDWDLSQTQRSADFGEKESAWGKMQETSSGGGAGGRGLTQPWLRNG
jgi:hypothetical protein